MEGWLTGAEAWLPAAADRQSDDAAVRAALAAARACGSATLESSALDAASAAAAECGRHREAYALWRRRVELLARMPRHEPSSGPEIYDTFHMGVELALSAGDPGGTLTVYDAARDDDIVGGVPYGAIRSVAPLVLMGRFDEAIPLAEEMWDGWHRAGGPAASWMGPAACSMVMLSAVRGDAAAADRWRARSRQVLGDARDRRRNFDAFSAFAEARVALH